MTLSSERFRVIRPMTLGLPETVVRTPTLCGFNRYIHVSRCQYRDSATIYAVYIPCIVDYTRISIFFEAWTNLLFVF